MVQSRYLLRFDDICPTMNWVVWNAVEAQLIRLNIRPILAVVPDNRDPALMVDLPRTDFWEKVRQWQALGWAIALHGYQHVYVNKDPGLMQLTPQSEFAGLSYQEQENKLKKGLAIFAEHGVRVDAWVAPSHSFDWVTVAILKALGIRIISDGLAFSPYRDSSGLTWVPQQFASMRPMPFGVWTFCYHPNHLSPRALTQFQRRMEQLAPRMISLPEAALLGNRQRSMADRLVGAFRYFVSSIRRMKSIK